MPSVIKSKFDDKVCFTFEQTHHEKGTIVLFT